MAKKDQEDIHEKINNTTYYPVYKNKPPDGISSNQINLERVKQVGRHSIIIYIIFIVTISADIVLNATIIIIIVIHYED